MVRHPRSGRAVSAEGTRVSCLWQVALPATTSDRPRSPQLAIVGRVELREVQIAAAHSMVNPPLSNTRAARWWPSLSSRRLHRQLCCRRSEGSTLRPRGTALPTTCWRRAGCDSRSGGDSDNTLHTGLSSPASPNARSQHGLETRSWVAVDAFGDRVRCLPLIVLMQSAQLD